MILLHTGGNMASVVLAQDVCIAGFFESHSQSKPAFIAIDGDKRHWLPIHSLMLM